MVGKRKGRAINNRLLERVKASFASTTRVLLLSAFIFVLFILIIVFSLWVVGKPTISPPVEAESASVAEAQEDDDYDDDEMTTVPPGVETEESSATPAGFSATQYSMTGPEPPRPPGLPDELSEDGPAFYVEGDDGVYREANINDVMVPVEDSSLSGLIKKSDRVDRRYYCLYNKSTGEWFAVDYEEYPPPTPVIGAPSPGQCQLSPEIANDTNYEITK